MLSQKDIFLAASEIADAVERARFLDEACAGDAGMRARVEALLKTSAPVEFLAESPVAAVLDDSLPELGASIGYFGDYLLLGEIARGATGVVFRARQVSLNRVIALKMLRDRSHLASPDDEKRFRAEAEAAAGLDHPGIVPIHEVGRHEGMGYYSMKLIEGGTLQSRGGEFREPRRAAALIAKVARAVQHAHGHGILHRDLKPSNILLDLAGEPHVGDFGIARQIGADADLTQTGQIVGTPHYMAPEQARGENRALTPAADIYSLGAMLYELLAGRKIFDGDSMLTLLKQVTEQPPAPLHLADRDLENIAQHCLEKSPAARYASAAELADDLERWLRGEPVKARPVGVVVHFAKWARRRPAHAALAAVGVAGLAFMVSRDGREAKDARDAAPAVSILEKDEAAAARRAIEWFHGVNGPLGYLALQPQKGELVRVKVGEPLPPGDFEIRKLWLDHWKSSDDAKFKIPSLTAADFRTHAATLKNLRTCFLRDLDLSSEDLSFLSQNPDLGYLTVENCRGGGDSLIPRIAGLKNLYYLNLDNSETPGDRLTGANLGTLACLPNLQSAYLMFCSLDDAGVATLVDRCPKIRNMGFAKTRITDAALRTLSRRALNELRLDHNPALTDAGLAELAKIPSLNSLFLYGSQNFTDAGVAAFQQAHPDCKIER